MSHMITAKKMKQKETPSKQTLEIWDKKFVYYLF